MEKVPQANHPGGMRLRYTEINQALRRTMTGRVVMRKHRLEEPAVELCSCCKGGDGPATPVRPTTPDKPPKELRFDWIPPTIPAPTPCSEVPQ